MAGIYRAQHGNKTLVLTIFDDSSFRVREFGRSKSIDMGDKLWLMDNTYKNLYWREVTKDGELTEKTVDIFT